MGVKGLWSLLAPTARPVKLESIGSKRLAVDASIWLHQFLKAMRDKDGNSLRSAHILGFFRRICKLLFYNIKPVFVFDGGVPVLKRQTIQERKKRRAGIANSMKKTAEKILSAQLQLAALKEMETDRNISGSAKIKHFTDVPDDVVYFDELGLSNEALQKRRKKDEYDLPPVNNIQSLVSRSDPRLATEEELRMFVEEFKPEDLDLDSELFHALPTELQYELISDLRIRSRQTSWERFEEIRRAAPTAFDFSQLQIKNLMYRNNVTQQLLNVNTYISKNKQTAPGRVASERNKEYILIKNEDTKDLGWTIGAKRKDKDKKEVGTQMRPVKINDSDEEMQNSDEDEDVEFEEVLTDDIHDKVLEAIKGSSRLEQLVSAVTVMGEDNEESRQPLFVKPKFMKHTTATKSATAVASHSILNNPEAFVDDNESIEDVLAKFENIEQQKRRERFKKNVIGYDNSDGGGGDEDHTNILEAEGSTSVLLASENESCLLPTDFYALWCSRIPESFRFLYSEDLKYETLMKEATFDLPIEEIEDRLSATKKRKGKLRDDDEVTFEGLTFYETFLQNTLEMHKKLEITSGQKKNSDTIFVWEDEDTTRLHQNFLSDDEDDFNYVGASDVNTGHHNGFDEDTKNTRAITPITTSLIIDSKTSSTGLTAHSSSGPMVEFVEDGLYPGVENLEKSLELSTLRGHQVSIADEPAAKTFLSSFEDPVESIIKNTIDIDTSHHFIQKETKKINEIVFASGIDEPPSNDALWIQHEPKIPVSDSKTPYKDSSTNDVDFGTHSLTKLSTPILMTSGSSGKHEIEHGEYSALVPGLPLETADGNQMDGYISDEDEMPSRLDTEENEFARFFSELSNKDPSIVQRELDQDLQSLQKQYHKEKRNTEDVSQKMAAECQELLRLFGIPYIISPMEAEAQCAELIRRNLVDGIVTDDSDVFLFGGDCVYKNMFNQSRYVECYLMKDLEREMKLTREQLVELAYLLGSDYTEGIVGVGPVTAMEVLNEFTGDGGLTKFRNWWLDVQKGMVDDNESAFQKKFRHIHKALFLSEDFPNPHVRDAYFHPTVDESDQNFEWGIPDLDALRTFLMENLRWTQEKVDEMVVPIIKEMNSRKFNNVQTTLHNFFDSTAGAGPFHRRSVHKSKRIRKVVNHWKAESASKLKNFKDSENNSDSQEKAEIDNSSSNSEIETHLDDNQECTGNVAKRKSNNSIDKKEEITATKRAKTTSSNIKTSQGINIRGRGIRRDSQRGHGKI